MSSNQLIIELPPPGTLVRELAVTAANMIGAFGGASVSRRGNAVIVSHGNLATAIDGFFNEVYRIYTVKSKYVRWPGLHVNDRGTLKKVIPGNQLGAIETYGDASEYFIKRIPQLLAQGGRLPVKLGRDSVELGRDDFSLFQLLKVELYEAGLTYNKPYQLELDVRLDERWASLLLAGFVVSYMGMRPSDGIVLSTIPDIYDRCSLDTWMVLNMASTLGRVPTNPTVPFILYIYATLILLLRDPSYRRETFSEVPEGLELLERAIEGIQKERCEGRQVELRIHRILIAGRTFTEVSREDLRMGGDIARLADLCVQPDCACLRQLREVARRGLGAEEPKILNALTVLYEALTGAKNPFEASYYIARTLRDQEEREGRVLVSPRCLRRLTEVLTGLALR